MKPLEGQLAAVLTSNVHKARLSTRQHKSYVTSSHKILKALFFFCIENFVGLTDVIKHRSKMVLRCLSYSHLRDHGLIPTVNFFFSPLEMRQYKVNTQNSCCSIPVHQLCAVIYAVSYPISTLCDYSRHGVKERELLKSRHSCKVQLKVLLPVWVSSFKM